MAAVTRLRCGSGHPTTLDGVRALLLEGIHPDAVSRLKADAYDVDVLGRALDEDELIERIGEVHLLGIRSKTKVTAKALAATQVRSPFSNGIPAPRSVVSESADKTSVRRIRPTVA